MKKSEVLRKYKLRGEKLKPGMKRKWLSALRSGDYVQGIGALVENDRFCCLGVAVNECLGGFDEIIKGRGVVGARIFTRLPENLLRELGLSAGSQTKLMDVNDSGASFKAIAALIDRDL